jgi:hypothetical protein
MIETENRESLPGNTRTGGERRSGDERRKGPERRNSFRTTWQRRSGQDRRGHKLYSRARVEKKG